MKLKKGSAAAKAYMAKIRAKRNVGAVATTKTGKVAKRLNKAQSDYNKDVDAYKYFVVVNNKITEGYEFKSDAIDAANEYEPKAKILTKQGLKKANIVNTSSQWKYTLGAAKTIAKFKKGDLVKIKGKSWIMVVDNIRHSNYGIMYYLENDVRGTGNGNAGTYFEIDLEKISTKKVGSTLKLKANEKRLGATPADLKANGYHKDTKSHNVRINVMSGTKAKSLIGSVSNIKKIDVLNFTKPEMVARLFVITKNWSRQDDKIFLNKARGLVWSRNTVRQNFIYPKKYEKSLTYNLLLYVMGNEKNLFSEQIK